MLTVIKPIIGRTRYTIFVPFTRTWCLDRWFESFEQVKFYKHLTDLVFYIDSDEVELYDKIYEWSMREGKKFRGCLIYVSGNKEPKDI